VCNECLAKNFLDDRIKKAELGGAYVARKCGGGGGKKNLTTWVS